MLLSFIGLLIFSVCVRISGRSLPLILCNHVRKMGICLRAIYLITMILIDPFSRKKKLLGVNFQHPIGNSKSKCSLILWHAILLIKKLRHFHNNLDNSTPSTPNFSKERDQENPPITLIRFENGPIIPTPKQEFPLAPVICFLWWFHHYIVMKMYYFHLSTRGISNYSNPIILRKSPMILFILIYIYYWRKKQGFFQYPNLHIMTFQALIEGYGRSKSHIIFPPMNKLNPIIWPTWFNTFCLVTSPGSIFSVPNTKYHILCSVGCCSIWLARTKSYYPHFAFVFPHFFFLSDDLYDSNEMVYSVGGKLVWGSRNKHTHTCCPRIGCGILKQLKALVRHSFVTWTWKLVWPPLMAFFKQL